MAAKAALAAREVEPVAAAEGVAVGRGSRR